MKAEEFFNNGFGKDCSKVHKKHVIELMTNFAKHYHQEQLRLGVVSQQRELLIAYRDRLNVDDIDDLTGKQILDDLNDYISNL